MIFYTIALLGLWLMMATVTFGFQSTPLIISDLIAGLFLIIFSLHIRKKPTASALWILALVGIWLNLAPLLFWAKTSGAYLNNTLIGTLIIALSVIFFPMPGQVPDQEPTIPPGWSYNPSSWPQRFPVAFFAFVCWMISRYLSAYQLGYIDHVWDPFFTPGTKGVLESSVSKLFPVSDAGLGAFAYTLEFLSTCQGGKARWRTSPWGVLLFGILVIPVSLVSVILIILQPLAVGTWCTLCLVTAVCMLLPIPLAIDEVVATLQYLKRSKKSVFLSGGEDTGAKKDIRTPSMNDSLLSIYKASLWGVSFPWNLIVTTFLGVFSMSYASSDVDIVLGAFTIVISVLSFSEFLRKARYLNIVLAVTLFITAFFSSAIILHASVAILLGIFSLRKGPIYENHSM